jgi:hypothetical protein
MGEGGGGWGASALGFGGRWAARALGAGAGSRGVGRGGPGGRKGAWATREKHASRRGAGRVGRGELRWAGPCGLREGGQIGDGFGPFSFLF